MALIAGEGLHIAIAASEAVPYAKTGGLADVVTALAMELLMLGHRVPLLLPGYRCQAARGAHQVVMRFSISVAGRTVEVTAEEELMWVTGATHPPWKRSAWQYIDLYWPMKRGKTKISER